MVDVARFTGEILESICNVYWLLACQICHEYECGQHKMTGLACDLPTHLTKGFMAGLHMTSLPVNFRDT
jgi:hypothetical protein